MGYFRMFDIVIEMGNCVCVSRWTQANQMECVIEQGAQISSGHAWFAYWLVTISNANNGKHPEYVEYRTNQPVIELEIDGASQQ